MGRRDGERDVPVFEHDLCSDEETNANDDEKPEDLNERTRRKREVNMFRSTAARQLLTFRGPQKFLKEERSPVDPDDEPPPDWRSSSSGCSLRRPSAQNVFGTTIQRHTFCEEKQKRNRLMSEEKGGGWNDEPWKRGEGISLIALGRMNRLTSHPHLRAERKIVPERHEREDEDARHCDVFRTP
jgi:hypothetical protein